MKFLGFELTLRKDGSPVQAAAPRLPNPSAESVLPNSLPPFGTNPPSGPIVEQATATLPEDYGERMVHSDPRELWYLALPNKLTPAQCLQILRSGLGGDIWQTWQLCTLMQDTWPVFRKAQHELREKASYVKYSVHPFAEEGEESTPRAKEKAGLVTRAFKSFQPDPFTDEKGFSGSIYDLADAMLNGLSMVELLWQDVVNPRHGREILPRAGAWVHPRHYTFTNDGKVAVFDDSYSRLNINMAKPGMSPDPNKFLCGQFVSRSGSSLGAGFMRPLTLLWAARQFNQEWMLNTAKRFGSPFLDITYKTGGLTQTELNKLTDMAKMAGANRYLLHPEGSTAAVSPAHPLGPENPQRYLSEEADRQCLYLLLGQEGSTVQTPGKLGNSDTHYDVKEERVAGLAQWLARNVLKQLAMAVLRVNYGECSECPEITPDFTKPLSASEVGTLATALTTSRIPFRADEVYKKLGMAQPEPGDTVLVAGSIQIQGDALTDEELFERQLEQQGMMMEQATGEQEDKSIKGSFGMARQVVRMRSALARASKDDLSEIGELVKAAEAAPHPNGELKELNEKIFSVMRRR